MDVTFFNLMSQTNKLEKKNEIVSIKLGLAEVVGVQSLY